MNDRLIFAHLTGYGGKGDDADLRAFDALACWARPGLMTSVTGLDGTPSDPRPGMGDHPTASAMFSPIMLGLYNRERTGRRSKVGTSLITSASVGKQLRFAGADARRDVPQCREGPTRLESTLIRTYLRATQAPSHCGDSFKVLSKSAFLERFQLS